jgi:hypothetical protein
MKTKTILFVICLLLLLYLPGRSLADSGQQYYRSAVHNGNRVKTVFGNWGVIGQPVDTLPRCAWIYSSNGYIGDMSPMVGAEVKSDGHVFHHIITTPVNRPQSNPRDYDPVTGAPWSFMPEGGYFNPNKQSIAMSDDAATWPAQWPDKMNDPADPGWAGSWNGYFGKRASADQESYFVMDDNNDKRFNVASNNTLGIAFHPDSTNPARAGLGLEMRVRGMQWAQLLAQDNIFWLYEISNTGTSTYDRAFFGLLVGTYVGVTGSTNSNEYDDDWSFYNVQENIIYTGDFPRNNSRNPFWIGSVGMVGTAFLESPGNPFDGIDNDGDAKSASSAAPLFTSADFDSVTIVPGSKIVLIGDDYTRRVITMPNKDTTVTTRGPLVISLKASGTKLSEGGLVTVNKAETVDPNAYDGVDNDLDGLIDENYYLHFHQIKKTTDTPPKVLIDVLRPARHSNFAAASSFDPYSMIDERRDDLIDNDRDWDINFDDVGRDGVRNPTNPDFGEGDGLPTSGYLASGFDTGLPGEPHIDKTDVDESDQIGLTSFEYFVPSNNISLGDKEGLWKRFAPGFFTVPKSIVNNQPQYGEDGDYIFGTGYFPLVSKHTERSSMALVYGGGNGGTLEDDIAALLRHKQTVQKIYNANFLFPIPPDPAPTLTAVAGDGEVKLYWDRKSEDAIDPVLRIKDFQGYKIFRATEKDFNDIFIVTDANGVKKGYQPSFQVDKKDDVEGYFRAPVDLYDATEGFTYYLGGNTGLVHDTTDRNLINGSTYYYAIAAYDNGDEVTGILPSQNHWKIELDQSGAIISHTPNVAIVTPIEQPPPGEEYSGVHPVLPVKTDASGAVWYKILAASQLAGTTYEITFNDMRDTGSVLPMTLTYTVRDTAVYTAAFTPNVVDTNVTSLPAKQLVPGTVRLSTLDDQMISPDAYIVNYERGTVKAKTRYALQPDTAHLRMLKVSYQYYPILKSPFINASPFTSETRDTDVFDGMQLVFANDWVIAQSGATLNHTRAYRAELTTIPIELNGDGIPEAVPTPYPSDYDVVISNAVIDSTANYLGLPVEAVKYSIFNRTEQKKVKSLFGDNDGNHILNYGDQLYIIESDRQNKPFYAWVINFLDTLGALNAGDTVHITTSKPFREGDTYRFTTKKLPTAVPQLAGDARIPSSYLLEQNYPNPFNPSTTIRYSLPASGMVTLKVFNILGQEVRELVHQVQQPGVYTAVFDARGLASGMYLYRLEAGAYAAVKKLVVLK